MGLQVVTMSFNDHKLGNYVCHGVEVLNLISDYREIIQTISLHQSSRTPVILILDDHKQIVQKKLQRAGLVVEALYSKTFEDSNAALSLFSKKHASGYPVFIINEMQGRGLDFVSSVDIEEKGGVYLLIAKMPKSFLQFRQYLGRTGRVGNKGQYSVILHDPEAKNVDGTVYLEAKLEALSNFDISTISKWSTLQNGEGTDMESREVMDPLPISASSEPNCQN